MSLPTTTTNSPIGKALNINAGITLLPESEAAAWSAGGFTASLWFKSTTSSGQSAAKVISRDPIRFWGISVVQNAVSSGKQNLLIELQSTNGTVTDSYTAANAVTLNKWHHLAVVYTGTVFTVYIDAVEISSRGNYDFSDDGYNRKLVVGSDVNANGIATTNKFVGGITDVKLFSTGLSSAKIRGIYQSPGSSVSAITDNTVKFGGGTSGNNLKVSSDGISAGHSTFASAPFSVTPAGAATINNITSTSTNNPINLDPHGTGVVTFKGSASRGAGQLILNCEQNSHGITIKGPPHSANADYTLTLPNTDGSADQVLKTDGSGNLDWVAQTGGSYGNSAVDTHLNVSGASSGQILSWNGSDYAWVADQTGGGGSVRTVSIDTNGDGSVNNTLESSETLVLKKGSNITLAESGGVVTISSSGGSGVTVVDEDDMSSNSATSVPSQQSVKAYVDNNAVKRSIFFRDKYYALTTNYTDISGTFYSQARTGIPHLREVEFTVDLDYGGIPASTVNDISLYLEANLGVSAYSSVQKTATHVGNYVSGYHLISFDGDVTGYFGDSTRMAASNTSNSYAQKFHSHVYYTPSANKTYVEYATNYGALMSSGTLSVYISPDGFNNSSSSYYIVKEFKMDRAQSTTTTQNVVQTFRSVVGVHDGEIAYRVRAREVSSGDSGVIQEVHGTIIDSVWEE